MNIVTIDPGDSVPLDQRPTNQHDEYLPQEEIGILVRGYPNITVIKEPFETISFDIKFDFIFVDGNHSSHNVLQDSHKALALMNSCSPQARG